MTAYGTIGGAVEADPAQELDAVHPGQPHVGEDHVGSQRLQEPDRLFRVGRDFGLVAGLEQERLHGARESPLVVHDEHGAAHAVPPAGSRTRTVVPEPGELSISNRPPFCST